MIGRVFRAVRAALARIWQGAADARTAGLPAHVRNGRSAKVEGRSRRVPLHLPPQAATGFFPLAEGGCERKRESQRLEHRQGLIIFEPARPIGTKTITDKNLLSCSVADCVRDPILGASARLPFGLRAMPAPGPLWFILLDTLCLFAELSLLKPDEWSRTVSRNWHVPVIPWPYITWHERRA